MKGQLPNEQGQCYCEKEGKYMKEGQFYTYRDGSKTTMCKSCLTMHVDNFDPETFTWLLKDLDFPYVPSEWVKLRDEAFAKNPQKMNGASVFGKYLSKMRLTQFKGKGWADSEELVAQRERKQAQMTEEQRIEREKYEQDVQQRYEAGEMSEAEYKTRMSTIKQYEDMAATPSEELDAAVNNPFVEEGFMKEEDLPNPAADLTQEDKLYLAMKWSRLYKPNEWIQLEKNYNEMMESFDIQDADTKNTLILICKTNLKINQCMDVGDVDGATKYSRMYDQLRKSAKLTAAQNKNEKGEFVDSIGELVAYCEREGGKIPKYEIKVPYDVIDKVIDDLKSYTKTLVYSDPSLAREIEDYLKNRKIIDEQQKDRQKAKEEGLEQRELTDEDYQVYNEKLEEQRLEDLAVEEEGDDIS